MNRTGGYLLLLLAFYPLLVFPQTTASAPEEELPAVEFLQEGGFYEQPIELHLAAPGATIYYTLNGSKPGTRSPKYREPLRISRTTVVRAVAIRRGRRGPTVGHTYFIREPETNFPVVSLSLPDWVLFDRRQGLFMQGTRAVDTVLSKPGANFWSRKEVLVNAEIFEAGGGRCVYRSESGMRLFGGMSRLFPQKSVVIVARKRYGKGRIDYPVFGKKGPSSVKFLVLRNGGSDWGRAQFRDALMTGLVDGWDIEKQAYRPAQVYINGQYWGIYDLREKVNRHFLADHNQEIDKDSVDLIEHHMTLKQGSTRHYRAMLRFLETHSLSDPANMARLEGMMDVDNFLNYQIAQIFFDNQDAGGNIKFWRPQTRNGRWRWILYDTDWGFGLHDPLAYQNNTLAFHTATDGPDWPNPPWSTFILRKLLENPGFRQNFVNRFADHLNTTFNSGRIEGHIDQLYLTLRPEMPRHLERWRLSRQKWESEVQVLRTFAQERPQHVWMHLMDYFNTGRRRHLELTVEGGGSVIVNEYARVRASGPFRGQYFEHYPITLKVVPDNGYRFSHWEGLGVHKDLRALRIQLREERTELRAVFEKYEDPLAGRVVINEISLNNRESGDWVELFNASGEPVYLHNWVFTDRSNEFLFPAVVIRPNDYLVLCEDSLRFSQAFPKAYNFIGGMNFGISKRREVLGLFTDQNAAVDSVSYSLPPVDSTFTLNLLLPSLDNSDLENWEVRWGPGTPSAANPYYVQSSIRKVQGQWMQVGLAASVALLCMLLLVLRGRGVF